MTIRGTRSLRLTRIERDRWHRITGFDPVDVHSEADLLHFVERCKQHYWGKSKETLMLHRLIDDELRRNLGATAA